MPYPNDQKSKKYLFIFLTWFLFSDSSYSITLNVSGWPISLGPQHSPSQPRPNDPLIGRLTCPTLTQLNLIKGISQPLLLKSIAIKPKAWTLSLNQEVRWWSGRHVSLVDLELFIRNQLPQVMKKQFLNVWQIPKYHLVLDHAQHRVHVNWDTSPPFGPYLFNDIPFYRSLTPNGFECAGKFKLSKSESHLMIATHQKSLSFKKIKVHTTPFLSVNTKAHLHFNFAQDYPANPWTRLPGEKISCGRPIDMPLISTILWNLDSPHAKNRTLRKALSLLIPRRSILRSTTANLGNLISGPFLKAHPGYHQGLRVLKFNPSKADHLLTQLGYIKNPQLKRLTPWGSSFTLKLRVSHLQPNVLTKIITDSFQSLGISISLTTDPDETVDGTLTGLFLPWPHGNLLPLLHSRSPKVNDLHSPNLGNLDDLLVDYAKSLTFEQPNFYLLKKIHKILYNTEPFSVIIQHRACMVPIKGFPKIPKILIRNPDWFLNLVLGSRATN